MPMVTSLLISGVETTIAIRTRSSKAARPLQALTTGQNGAASQPAAAPPPRRSPDFAAPSDREACVPAAETRHPCYPCIPQQPCGQTYSC